jgi:hypothetical protein
MRCRETVVCLNLIRLMDAGPMAPDVDGNLVDSNWRGWEVQPES